MPPPPTVLIVDDDATIRRAFESVLSTLGYRVLTAAGGEPAYALLQSQPVDAVLLDVRMPDMSGLALYTAIVARYPSLLSRIALLTAHAEAEGVREWLAVNRCTVFRKPFRPEELLGWLDLVGQKRTARRLGGE